MPVNVKVTLSCGQAQTGVNQWVKLVKQRPPSAALRGWNAIRAHPRGSTLLSGENDWDNPRRTGRGSKPSLNCSRHYTDQMTEGLTWCTKLSPRRTGIGCRPDTLGPANLDCDVLLRTRRYDAYVSTTAVTRSVAPFWLETPPSLTTEDSGVACLKTARSVRLTPWRFRLLTTTGVDSSLSS